MGGVDIRTVQELMGHKDIRMTMRYAHLATIHIKNAITIPDSHYLDTGGSEQENQDAAVQA
jgi:site-specific recombinase XerD